MSLFSHMQKTGFFISRLIYDLGVCMLFGFNLLFNNLSVISRRCLPHYHCDRELNAHFYIYSAASMCYKVPDSLLYTTPSHITLTFGLVWLLFKVTINNFSVMLGRTLTFGLPVLVLPRKYECQARSNLKYHC